jgi:excisionase family DNA binding protein
MATDEKEILTITEAAKLLKLGTRSVYKLVQAKKIPGKKVLNKWRFEKSTLIKWVTDV